MVTVSIIVLNWNGKHFLKDCLHSLQKLSYPKVELIVVDNNSTDESQEFVKKKYPHIKLIENKENVGFAEGNNIGYRASKGEYIMFLNNDTVVTPNFLEPLLEDFKKDSQVGCIQPQIQLKGDPGVLDGVGAFLTPTGFLYHFGYLKKRDDKKYSQKLKIFSAKGACMMLSRKVIQKVGAFDKDFFIFFEETDLCYRVWLAGYSVQYESDSVIYHVGGGDTGTSNSYKYARRTYLSFRNMVCSYLKNFSTYNLLTIFPLFIFLLSGLCVYYCLTRRFHLAKVILEGYLWNITNLSSTLQKRKIIQKKLRKISDRELNKHIMKFPKLTYYYALFTARLKDFQD